MAAEEAGTAGAPAATCSLPVDDLPLAVASSQINGAAVPTVERLMHALLGTSAIILSLCF
jgi:hypothetical protein